MLLNPLIFIDNIYIKELSTLLNIFLKINLNFVKSTGWIKSIHDFKFFLKNLNFVFEMGTLINAATLNCPFLRNIFELIFEKC